jgi:hypothetical protein
MQHSNRSIVVVAAVLFAACGGSSSPADAGDVNCSNDSRVSTYMANMTVNSKNAGIKVSLVSSPAPPAKGNNVWTLHVTNASGTAMSGLSLGYGTIMPDHGHGSPISSPKITDKGGGDYDVNPVDLFMPGVWHVWFYNSSTPADTADFFFCVQG